MWEERVKIDGVDAPRFKVIRLSDYGDAHVGPLIEADAMTGAFSYRDHVNNELRHANLGPHAIKIIRRV